MCCSMMLSLTHFMFQVSAMACGLLSLSQEAMMVSEVFPLLSGGSD